MRNIVIKAVFPYFPWFNLSKLLIALSNAIIFFSIRHIKWRKRWNFNAFKVSSRIQDFVRRWGGTRRTKIVKNFHRRIIRRLHLWRKPRAGFQPQEVESSKTFRRNQAVDLGDSSLDYEACGNCPGVVALGHAPGGCRSEATTVLYALPRIRSSARSPSISMIINVIFGSRENGSVSWWRIVCVMRSFPAIKSRTVCNNNFRSIGDQYSRADYGIIVATCPDPIRFIVYIRKSD